MEGQLGHQQRLRIGAPNNNPAQIPPVEMQMELYFHLFRFLDRADDCLGEPDKTTKMLETGETVCPI